MEKPLSELTEEDPDFAACFTAFFLKNHIDPFAYPNKVASREQTEFMVFLEGQERYYPCTDKMFQAIMSRTYPAFLKKAYKKILDRIISMVEALMDNEYDRQYLKTLIEIKYDDETRTGLLIPSRLEKRLYKIILSRTHIENPFSDQKRAANKNADRFLTSETYKKALNHLANTDDTAESYTLSSLKRLIKKIEFSRLLSLMAHKKIWSAQKTNIPPLTQVKKMLNAPIKGDGVPRIFDLLSPEKKKILWIADESGEFVIDLNIAQFLADLGHIVILVIKEAPFFKQVCIADTRTDPILEKRLEHAQFIHEKTISKNNLVKLLKHDQHLYILSDGTREDLNLLLASTTFSRVFKEVDCVISRGAVQKEILIDSHFQFTQDIINITAKKGGLDICFKARHPECIRFSHQQLEEKAQAIITEMKLAKKKQMTVMFYSGIIGSIPGKIDVAKKIMTTFIKHLHDESANLFIINPSLYYEPGMDADDLMYMWEIVQRSGQIDIWRFQTSDDIAKTFAMLNRKVPPEWIGKDSTYSTGCTKEMRIAQDVLQRNPEMQLIGPAFDKFIRRNEYGVGSMYDQRLADL